MARNLWVVIFDVHYPFYHRPTWEAAKDFIQKNPKLIAGFVLAGDQHHNEEISHWSNGKPLLRPPGSYKRNTEGFGVLLNDMEALLPREAEKVWIEGNHEDWVQQLIERQPELQGTMERPLLYNLAERGWKVLALGEGKKLGKLLVVHGEGLSGIGNQASVYHSKRAVESFCTSVLYGHFHSAQSYTKVLPHSAKDKWIAYSSPACCTLNPSYLKNRPNAWVSGFTIVELHDPPKSNSNFNVYPVIVSDGTFAFGGNVYGKKA